MKKLFILIFLFIVACGTSSEDNTTTTIQDTTTTTIQDTTTTTIPPVPKIDFDIMDIYNTKLVTELCSDAKDLDTTSEECLRQYRDNLETVFSYEENLQIYLNELNKYFESYPAELTEEYSLFFEFINTEYSKIFETYEIVDTKYKERFVRELIIWAEKKESDAIKKYVEQFKLNKIFDIKIFTIDIGSMKNQLSLSIKNNSAPDIVLGPHDWLEDWLNEGLIDEINLNSDNKDVFQVGIDAFTVSDKLYGYAYRMESIALYYNLDLVQDVPTNWSDMNESCKYIGTLLCVSLPGGGMASDAYHNYFLIGSTGGYIFNYEDGFDTNDIGLDNNYSLEAADYLDFLVKEGVIASQDYGAAISAFQQGASPYLITGPWAKADASSVNYKIAQIPTFNGLPAKPFVSLRGAMVTTGAKNKPGAVRFINEYFSTYELQKLIWEYTSENQNFVPASKSLVSYLEKDDSNLGGFASAASNGTPMPYGNSMGYVWGPLGDALLIIRNQEYGTNLETGVTINSARDAIKYAAKQIREALNY